MAFSMQDFLLIPVFIVELPFIQFQWGIICRDADQFRDVDANRVKRRALVVRSIFKRSDSRACLVPTFGLAGPSVGRTAGRDLLTFGPWSHWRRGGKVDIRLPGMSIQGYLENGNSNSQGARPVY